MKYKVVANGTIMESDVSALRAMNIICGIMQGQLGDEPLKVEIYYRAGSETVGYCWKLENSFAVFQKPSRQ